MSVNGPTFSVVTVVLNEETRISASIESVAAQTYREFEHIVVDGGSTDRTLEILHQKGHTIDRLISEADRGISDAFNKGVCMAGGELIGILNAGDSYGKDALLEVAEVFRSNPEIDVFCGSIQFWESGSPTLLCRSDPRRIEKETSIYHPTVFIKKRSYQKFGLYDENYRYAMDYELLLRFKRQGATFLALDKILANMALDGISSQKWYSGLREVMKARSKYFPLHNVAYYHSLAISKNLIARALKGGGLRNVYQAYWQSRNKLIENNRRRQS